MKIKAFGAMYGIAWVLVVLGLGCGSSTPQVKTNPNTTHAPEWVSGGWHGRVVPPHLVAAEMAAYERARPVFVRHCARCHSSDGAKATQNTLSHFSMDGYPFGGHHQAEMSHRVRKVLGATGEPPTMPRDERGAVKGQDLELILAWADSFDRSAASGPETRKEKTPSHGSHDHQH